MRDYELIFIIHPDLDETAVTDTVSRVRGWITDGGGEIAKTDLWGKRKLAYPIRKQKEGQYVFIETHMDPKLCAVVERNLRFLEPVMRYSLVAK